MGVAVAWPTETFDVVDVDISRLSDKRDGGWPEETEPSTFGSLWKGFRSYLEVVGIPKANEPIDPWTYSKKRFNVLITATLEDKKTKDRFCIGNYHMPCAFYAPQVMAMHLEMAAKHVQNIANKQQQLPYILAG